MIGQEVKWKRERERGTGSGKVCEPGLELGTQYVGTLPKMLLVPENILKHVFNSIQ